VEGEDVVHNPVRWGILGTGGIASTFVTDLRLTDSGVAVAVGSRSQGSADRFADEFGIVNRHASYESLAADPDVDVIYVATPHPMLKEGWDNIDIFGWLGYPMQIKVDFLCRDSILAAPLVLDLVLFTDLAQRAGLKGVQEWLSFYFKSPQHAPSGYPEHDLFIQQTKLKNTLRWLMGEEQITHLGLENNQD
jgi:hypothetical protein